MKRSRALVENRRNKVLLALQSNGFVKVQELADELQVSPLTIRRDLQYLEDQKKLERFYGGATVKDRVPEIYTEQDEVKLYRQRIAEYAASLVEDGDTIFINTSSTALQMIKYIKDKRVTVITNNGKAIFMEHSSNVSIILSGGELREIKEAMVGEFATNNISKVTAKKSFIGCSGLSPESGMTTEILSEVNINQLMLQRVTGTSYILADHTKLGRNSSFVSCPTESLLNVITDEKAPEEITEGFLEHEVNVTRVTIDGRVCEDRGFPEGLSDI